MTNLIEMASLALQASLGRHVARSLAGSAKQISKQKRKTREFIVDSLDKGSIRWKELKEK